MTTDNEQNPCDIGKWLVMSPYTLSVQTVKLNTCLGNTPSVLSVQTVLSRVWYIIVAISNRVQRSKPYYRSISNAHVDSRTTRKVSYASQYSTTPIQNKTESESLAWDENKQTAERHVDDGDPHQAHQRSLVKQFPGYSVSERSHQQLFHKGSYRMKGSLIRAKLINVYSLKPASASIGSSMY